MFVINVDCADLLDLLNLTEKIKPVMQDAARDMTVALHAKITELANQKLKSRRELFIKGLSFQQVSADTWVISLDKSAAWIDDGMPAHEMLDYLLKSPKAKRAKDGSIYLTVPFGHGPGKGPTNSTPAQTDLTSTLKAEMKKRGIPFAKIEKDDQGAPKIGKLHSFDITKLPIKNFNGPGQGHGPIGAVKQGFSSDKKSGSPFLQGVSVYQSKVKDKFGNESVKRSIMTFRIASSKHRGQDRWKHPGVEGVHIFDEAAKWARETFEKDMAPLIIQSVKSRL